MYFCISKYLFVLWGYSLIPTPHALTLDYSACVRPINWSHSRLTARLPAAHAEFLHRVCSFSIRSSLCPVCALDGELSRRVWLRLKLFGVLNIGLWGISSPRWHAYHRKKITRRFEWRRKSPLVGETVARN